MHMSLVFSVHTHPAPTHYHNHHTNNDNPYYNINMTYIHNHSYAPGAFGSSFPLHLDKKLGLHYDYSSPATGISGTQTGLEVAI